MTFLGEGDGKHMGTYVHYMDNGMTHFLFINNDENMSIYSQLSQFSKLGSDLSLVEFHN